MKTLKSVTLENGITFELLEGENNYHITSSVGGNPIIIAHLDKAIATYEKRVKLFSRFVKSSI